MPEQKTEKNIVWLKEVRKEDIPVVGGKGANLGEMYSLNLSVPGGFIVTAYAYRDFIERAAIKSEIMNLLSGLDVENNDALQKTAEDIQKLIISTLVPNDLKNEIIEYYSSMISEKKSAEEILKSEELPFVAVRSSATAEDLPEASFAGQQATFLNVRGADTVVKAVRACWASLFTARAIYYRQKNNFDHTKVYIAVVVQKMVNSTTSGIMFTVNPVTNNTDEIVVEVIYGLGEAIVSGAVNPNSFIIDKATIQIKSKEIREQDFQLIRDMKTGETIKVDVSAELKNKQCISDAKVVELAKLGRIIEEHYGKPQDIEWAAEGDNLFIVQSRAVTTLRRKARPTEQYKGKQVDLSKVKAILSGTPASPGVASGTVKIIHDPKELDKVKKGDVLVTEMTNPDMVPAMQRATAIVTNEGGATCHAAIVSREMGIPCIVGTGVATKLLKDDEIVTVDATHGHVYEGVIEIEEHKTKKRISPAAPVETATKEKVICGLPAYADRAASTGADGVGLVRVEFMIVNAGTHPSKYIREGKEEDYIKVLVEGIGGIAKAFKDKPVWMRTSDIRTDEYSTLRGGNEEPTEINPMIGWHGIRRALDEPGIIKAEFNAIKKLKEQGVNNVGVMIPFVIRTEELIKAKQLMREVGLEPRKDVEFGVMIETPASCWIIEEICKEGIDFISFGTNDLTQCTLGIDRDNGRIAKLYDEMHPAVLGEIAHVIRTCRKYGVKTSICGQAASRPEMVKVLVMLGIDSVSPNPDAVEAIREIVAKTERELMMEIVHEKYARQYGPYGY